MSDTAIHPSVCLSICLSHGAATCLRYRHAGCLQLSHRRPPEMCGLRTRRDFWIHDDLIGGETIYQSSNWHRRGGISSCRSGGDTLFCSAKPEGGLQQPCDASPCPSPKSVTAEDHFKHFRSSKQHTALGKGNGKLSIAVSNKSHCYGKTRAIWDHTVLPATRQR